MKRLIGGGLAALALGLGGVVLAALPRRATRAHWVSPTEGLAEPSTVTAGLRRA
jgi:hypothetical protein